MWTLFCIVYYNILNLRKKRIYPKYILALKTTYNISLYEELRLSFENFFAKIKKGDITKNKGVDLLIK